MKILLINGSVHKDGASARALAEINGEILKSGAETLHYEIGKMPRYACSACGGCKSGNGCVYRDIDSLIELSNEASAIIICTPTHYASAPGNLTSVLSRLLFSSKKSVAHKPIGVAAVGRRGGVSAAANEVKKFFEFSSSPIISGIYPAILYASDFKSAEADKEGLENMRSLANNVIYIARCIELGNESGVLPPDDRRIFKTDISALTHYNIHNKH
ncbi:MAG: NAD(P)H-dependent oxidoreductase [Ruminococcaceae bacterium]|nr:NAD(P)H-dependent oxidoreductase [Oscillospiraceae bacterium]